MAAMSKRTLLSLATLAALLVPAAPGAALLPPAAKAGELVFYGHVRALAPQGHRYVPRSAKVTVLTSGGTRGIASTRVTVAELAQILKGGNPKHRKLFGSALESGFWARVATDTVRSLDEQYHP